MQNFTTLANAGNQENETDTTPPGKISNFSYTATNSSVRMTWINPSDSDFNGTLIYLNGTQIATLNKTQSSYTIINLAQNTTYNVTIATIDTSGNTNPSAYNVTTTIGNQTTPPITPTPTPVIHHHKKITDLVSLVPEEETKTARVRGVSIGNYTISPPTKKASPVNYSLIALLLAFLILLLLILIILLLISRRR